MPNWVSNVVKCDNSDALHQLRDFNLIVPEHPAIALLSGLAAQHAAQLFQQGKSWREVAADAEFVGHLAREQKDIPVKHRLTPARAARRYLLYYKVHGYVTGTTGVAPNGEPSGTCAITAIRAAKSGLRPPGRIPGPSLRHCHGSFPIVSLRSAMPMKTSAAMPEPTT